MPETDDLKTLFDTDFQRHREETSWWTRWEQNYLAHVEKVMATDEQAWLTPAFQEFLWEDEGMTSVGLGRTVVIKGAFKDEKLARSLWDLRSLSLEQDTMARARQLDAQFERLLKMVSPAHNERRPAAKLARIFASIFPYDVLCVLDQHQTHVLRRSLGMKKAGLELIGQHVLIRQRLRDALGTPGNVKEAIEQSTFAWYLKERAETPVVGVEETEVNKEPPEAAGPGAGPKLELLRLLPADAQRKGLPQIPKGIISAFSAVVRVAEHGSTRQELISVFQEYIPKFNARSADSFIMLVRRLGLLELQDNTLRPTARGRELYEGEAPSDVLAPVLITQIFGVAQLLHELEALPAGLTMSELAGRLRTWYPPWKTDITAQSIASWCEQIGLLTRKPGPDKLLRFSLSDAGVEWASKLPRNLEPWRMKDTSIDGDDDEGLKNNAAPGPIGINPPAELRTAKFEDVEAALLSTPSLKHLVFPPHLPGLVHGALHALDHKRFVLLAGLSGTGKTSLARAYAQAYCTALKLPFDRHYLQIAVRPDWTDPTALLGYYNPLSNPPAFESTSTLNLLIEAQGNPEQPYFLCLDEMNLARVEHYFAPFLSAMEGQSTFLAIHAERDGIDGIPDRIPWPRNLFILGTVNMDETTHAFSDKVLDRAFSFELWTADLKAWRVQAALSFATTEVLDDVLPVLEELYQALLPARRHFGYRTCHEIVAFCQGVPATIDRKVVLDMAILTKILPKVRGDDSGPLPGALEAVIKICTDRGLKQSAAKAGDMRIALKAMGVVRGFS